MLVLLLLLSPATGMGECSPETLTRYPGGYPAELDFGIYWVGHNDMTAKAGAEEPTVKQLFDPSQNTLIYFHGWTGGENGWTQNCARVTGSCPGEVCPGSRADMLLMEPWLAAGWNVGLFYWDQFADEECARDAEQKIWFDRTGSGLRWKSYNVSTGLSEYRVYTEEDSVADLCVTTLEHEMSSFRGGQVRFVSYSLGAQLAVRCAALLHKRGHAAAPQRLALLEPYFSRHHFFFFRCSEISTDTGLGNFAAHATVEYVRNLYALYGVVTEVYKSSMLTRMVQWGYPNKELESLVLLVEYHPKWCGSLGPLDEMDIVHLRCRHSAVFPMYLLSFGNPVPRIELGGATALLQSDVERGSALLECATPSAACSDGELRQWVERQLRLGGGQVWTQVAGLETFDIKDDMYSLSPPPDREMQLVSRAVLGRIRTPGQESWLMRRLRQLITVAPIPVLAAVGVMVIAALAVITWSSCKRCSGGDDAAEASTQVLSDEEALDEVEARKVDIARARQSRGGHGWRSLAVSGSTLN